MDFMTKQESYAERRQLFKNIWETAMNIDEKDDIMNKPKVIKTLRLDEVDKCVIGKKKKQRIKNLRHVCNKILDFCDRQDADDIFYEQMAAEGQEALQPKTEPPSKKTKTGKVKKKFKKAKSMCAPLNEIAPVKISNSSQKDEFMKHIAVITSRIASPIKLKRTVLAKKASYDRNKVKSKASPNTIGVLQVTNSVGDRASGFINRHKTYKKKRTKRKKPEILTPSTILDNPGPK